jgi:hypothetical protein
MKSRSRTKTRSRKGMRLDWRPGWWQLVGLAAATATVMNALAWRSGADQPMDGWYQLKSIVPGERVPVWLHTGFAYRGELTSGGQLVRLFAPDSTLTAVVNAALVTEVAGPS